MILLRFADKKLEKAFLEHKTGAKMWGDVVAQKYVTRLTALQAVNEASEFTTLYRSWRDHPLKADREGQRAFTLHDRWRVVYRPDADGQGVLIEEVSNHYGD